MEIDTGTTELLCVVRDGVALITLNRPEARNAMSPALTEALRDQIKARGDDPNVGSPQGIQHAKQMYAATVHFANAGQVDFQLLMATQRIDDLVLQFVGMGHRHAGAEYQATVALIIALETNVHFFSWLAYCCRYHDGTLRQPAPDKPALALDVSSCRGWGAGSWTQLAPHREPCVSARSSRVSRCRCTTRV